MLASGVANGSAEQQVRAPRADLRGVRILVVDDIDLNRSIFLRQLQWDGHCRRDGRRPGSIRAVQRTDEAGEPFDSAGISLED